MEYFVFKGVDRTMTFQKKESGNHQLINRILLIAGGFLLLLMIAFYREINAWIAIVIDIFSPVILGLVFAYVLNPMFRLLERRVFSRVYPSAARRAISLLLTYIIAIIVVALIALLILPQLVSTLMNFISNYQLYIDGAIASINGAIESVNNIIFKFFNIKNVFGRVDASIISILFDNILNDLSEHIPTLTSKASLFLSGATDIIFATFISIYFLSSKEKRYSQVMKFRNAVFSNKVNQRITKICTTANNLFGKFVEGRLLDSFLVGLLTYVVISIFQIPYALLIASSIAIWNMIPTVGFLIGFIPAVTILLFTDATLVIPFTLLMFVIYQIDSNIISPRIVGYNTGVGPLCVIIAICTMGAMFGLVGLIIAVPLFATLIDISNNFIEERLRHKRMPDDVENYFAPDLSLEYLHMSKSQLGRLIIRIEKRALYIHNQIANGHEASLSKKDRNFIATYQRARKINFISEVPPEVLIQFSAESVEKSIRSESNRRYNEMLETAMGETNLEETQESFEIGGEEA
jgi:predicted PurR-regulated permease PerM